MLQRILRRICVKKLMSLWIFGYHFGSWVSACFVRPITYLQLKLNQCQKKKKKIACGLSACWLRRAGRASNDPAHRCQMFVHRCPRTPVPKGTSSRGHRFLGVPALEDTSPRGPVARIPCPRTQIPKDYSSQKHSAKGQCPRTPVPKDTMPKETSLSPREA